MKRKLSELTLLDSSVPTRNLQSVHKALSNKYFPRSRIDCVSICQSSDKFLNFLSSITFTHVNYIHQQLWRIRIKELKFCRKILNICQLFYADSEEIIVKNWMSLMDLKIVLFFHRRLKRRIYFTSYVIFFLGTYLLILNKLL